MDETCKPTEMYKSRFAGVCAESYYMCQQIGGSVYQWIRYVVLLEFARKNRSDPIRT